MHVLTLRPFLLAVILTLPVCGAEIAKADLQMVQAKLALAHRYLELTWRELFPQQKPPTPMPRIVPYQRGILSGCGRLGPRNAYFCGADNSIYYDEVFLTQLAKAAGVALRTDGDYAAVVALAHELGHAVRFRQDSDACAKAKGTIAASLICSPNPFEARYLREAQADCYAGAVTKRFREARLLDPGDFEEAQFAMGNLGDAPILKLSKIEMEPYMMNFLQSHGEGTARRRHFEVGYKSGAIACRDSSQVVANDRKFTK